MDMRSLIHQGLSPSSSSGSAPASSSNSSATLNSSFPTSSALPVPSFPAMRQQPTIFQRAAAPGAAVPQAPTLAPLRFIIPSSRTTNSFGTGLTAAIPSASANPPLYSTLNDPEREPLPQHSLLYPQDRFATKTEEQQLSPTGENMLNGLSQTKKITPKRTRQPKLSNRSTKSKARPGLRKGKWTEEESRYAAQLTNYFKEGLLPIERGTMLRLYLSQKLNCEPMRITKKFTGGECIGKQVYRPCSPTPGSRVRIMQAQLELVALEAAFIKRLKENREDPPIATDEFDVRCGSSSNRSRPVPLKPRMFQDKEGDEEDANAVGLLLDFFYKANRNEKKKGKRASADKDDECSSSKQTEAKEGAVAEEEQIVKEPIETTAPTSPSTTATNSENDTAINSPTKRMRALSVSCVDPAAAKRSRIGSFSTVTAA
ncbi:hypothetical protein GN244_ATG03412 [Phytophthora infestans]|uniref:Myb-like domain-containing protein n=1 Tax=Phytophthora infestans TaxID=4787 RepID=A0A833T1C2_PHYIN|nr:hypothetical protein GN244_ATG03412 [Phytophthora infestans]KAF4127740.1 hypothetical protein GN958_ATG23106 [Phytophthora infestans]